LHIQWKYEIKPDKWLDFPLYICSQIELAFNQKKSDVQFVNEENVVSIIWFESMIYSELEESITSYKVKRHGYKSLLYLEIFIIFIFLSNSFKKST